MRQRERYSQPLGRNGGNAFILSTEIYILFLFHFNISYSHTSSNYPMFWIIRCLLLPPIDPKPLNSKLLKNIFLEFFFLPLSFCLNLLRLDFNKAVKINTIRSYTSTDVKERLSKSPLWFLMHKAKVFFVPVLQKIGILNAFSI